MADIKEYAVKFTFTELELNDIWEVVALLIHASTTDGEHHKQYDILQALRILVNQEKWRELMDIFQPTDGIPS
jgi:16S rRNA C1402 N4-methylase RsmH